ncbi:hypothetical protein TrRE_jg13428 [Triparma retinervis]|uniref:PDZ domain-containing protein n=1 Tax=Triparma retinervis TaxID=2557542 RepID=A0A9W7CPK8_9STRA|nr:hypothetical protein TrRE_jg13428 [Triparma retinervis]
MTQNVAVNNVVVQDNLPNEVTGFNQNECDVDEVDPPGGRFLRDGENGTDKDSMLKKRFPSRNLQSAGITYDVSATYSYVVTPQSDTAPRPVVSKTQFQDAIEADPTAWDATFQEAVEEELPEGTTADTPKPEDITTTGTSTNPPPDTEEANGLGAGAISGIVIGSVAFVGIVGVAMNEVIKKRNRAAAFGSQSEDSDDFSGYDVERNTTRRRTTEHIPVVGGGATTQGASAAAAAAPRRDIDFVRSDEEDGNAISNDLKTLEAKINRGNVNKSATDDLVGGVIAAAGARMGFMNGGLDSASSSYDNMTSNTELDIETVFAPSGKLGIVVDSTTGGPTVHSIREISPLIGILNVGDKIISIDDINVTKMSAGGVTKLMAQKSQQSERKIAFQKTA